MARCKVCDTDSRAVRPMRRCRRRSLTILLAASGLILPGCATIYEGHLGYDEGWRVGRIAELGLDDALAKHSATQCRSEVLSGRDAREFAVVGYLGYRIKVYRIARLPSEPAVGQGDFVYININDCARRAVARPRARPRGR